MTLPINGLLAAKRQNSFTNMEAPAGTSQPGVRQLAQQRSASLTELNKLCESGASLDEVLEASEKLALSRPETLRTLSQIPIEGTTEN